MQSRGLSDPAAGAGELDRFVAVGGAELGRCRGEVVADCAGGQGRAFRDFIDGGAACSEFQDVGFAGGERAVAGADGVGGEFGVDVAAATVDGAYHVGQDLGRDGLGQEPATPAARALFEMPWPSVAGEDEAAAGGQLSDQLLGDSDPVRAGHLQIQHGQPEPLARFWAEALGYVLEPPPGDFATWDDWRRDAGLPESWLGRGTDCIIDPDGATQRPGKRRSRPLCRTTSRAGPGPAQGII